MTSMIGVRCAVVCPSASSISPCTCGSTSIDPNGLYLNCAKLGLSDSQMSSILDVLLNSNGTSPLVHLDASSNNLKKIPSQISKFNSIQRISLDINQISSIPSDAFNFPSETYYVEIYLDFNQITSIAPNTFSQGDNNKFNSIFSICAILFWDYFINFILFLQAIIQSSNWPTTNWRNSIRMSLKRRWRIWLDQIAYTMAYTSEGVYIINIKAINQSSIHKLFIF